MMPKNMTPHDYRTYLSGVMSGLDFARNLSMQLDRKVDDEDCGCGKPRPQPAPTDDELPPGFERG